LPDLASILNCEPERVIAKGVAFELRRPTVADLAEALHVNATTPTDANPWMLKRHLLTENGVPVFASIDDARNCPLALATLLIPLIEGLYAEGRD
jgi:hypothetical protein